MFPIGIKIKKFNEKNNITSQLQCMIDKEINDFYNYIPLKKEPFDKSKKDESKTEKKGQKGQKYQKRETKTKKIKKIKINLNPR